MANLASVSAAGLNIHSCKSAPLRDGSRKALMPYPDLLANGQRFRRRADGVTFQLLEGSGRRLRAWNGIRVVRLAPDRLLETQPDGGGLFYEYVGGGITKARLRRNGWQDWSAPASPDTLD
jgi:hypothetical protein